SRFVYRSTSTRVLPVPADASRTTFRVGSTAAARSAASGRSPSACPAIGSASSNGRRGVWIFGFGDMVLPTDAGERTDRAQPQLRRARRERAAFDPVHGLDNAEPGVGEDARQVGRPARERLDATLGAVHEIRGLAEA